MQRLSSPNPGSLSSPDLNSSDVTPTSSCSTGKKSKSSYTDVTSSASSEKTYTLKGTRLIVLHNFQGKAFDDLPVRPGEYVFANLKDQIVPGFIWAYSPNTKKSGFIPEDHVKEPVVTDIWKMIEGSYSLVSPCHQRKRQMNRVVFVIWRWKVQLTRVIRKDITSPLSSETSPEERHSPVILVTLYGNTGPIHALVG